MDQKELVSQVLALVGRFAVEAQKVLPELKEVFLYGSWARQEANAESDIDVAVICRQAPGNYLAAGSLLYKTRRNIDLRIEPLLLTQESDPSGLCEQIRREGLRVYPA